MGLDDNMIRLAAPDDEPFLWRMLAYASAGGDDSKTVAEVRADPIVRRYLDGWGRVGDVGVVAERDGAPMGAAWCRHYSSEAPAYGFVDEATPELAIACVPPARGLGIGRRLIAALLDAARADGGSAVSLSVALRNEVALRLYRDCGFEPLTPISEAPDGSSVTLVARLDR